MNYKGLLLVVFSIVIAITVTWLNNFWLSYQEFVSAGNEREIDYYLSDFSLLNTAANGDMKYYMQGQHLVHKNSTGGSEIFQPVIQAADSDGHALFIRAEKAQQKKSQGIIELAGSVLIQKTTNQNKSTTHSFQLDSLGDKDADFHLKTSNLSFDPIKREIFTDASITLTTKDGLLTGTGLRSQLDQQELRILSNVHAQFDPNP
ncbi:MAG: LPS export ABC transporter periplasmic protein LptC [Cocleimonas sp.]|nr:LPS export ABC transporter periplasmic protein LptC [Cocleimonas sp.]